MFENLNDQEPENDDDIENIEATENIENIETPELYFRNISPEGPRNIIAGPEDGHNKLTVTPREEKNQNQVYRWSINEENNYRNNRYINTNRRNATKEKKSAGLRIFAAVMSVMFLFTATATGYFLLDYINDGNFSLLDNISGNNNNNNNAESGEKPPAVLSNQDAVDASNNEKDALEGTSAVVPADRSAPSGILSTEEAIAKVNPSVVCIEVETEYQGFSRRSGPYVHRGVGTGFIVSADGYIATNYHVVSTADKITVTLFSGEKYTAELIGGNEPEDLAIIKINAGNLPVAELGDSDALVQGQTVVAIGTPAGIEFAWTATQGIVSSASRTVDVNGEKTMEVIQTDASINPGNSGGPLINMRGQVIGINSMKLASTLYEGMGFAIPINIAIPVFNEIISNPGDISRAPVINDDMSTVSFGLEGITVDEERSEYYNIPQGWQIRDIIEGGPSDGSGLQISDIIVELDGEPVKSRSDLLELKLKYKPGDTVTVTIYRNGDLWDFDVTLGAR